MYTLAVAARAGYLIGELVPDFDSGREIDIVAECRRDPVASEVKASTSVSREDLRHLGWFASDGPGAGRRVTSILLYLGEEPLMPGERRVALPVSVLWAT